MHASIRPEVAVSQLYLSNLIVDCFQTWTHRNCRVVLAARSAVLLQCWVVGYQLGVLRYLLRVPNACGTLHRLDKT
jgi:hypothetical protein